RAHHRIDHDEAALRPHPQWLEAEIVAQRAASDGHQDALGLDRARLRLAGERDARRSPIALQTLEAMIDEHVDPLLAARTLELAPEIDVPPRQQCALHLDDGNLRAEAGEGVRELDAARAPADDDQRRRQPRVLERLATRLHQRAVDLEAGQRA